MNASFVVLVAGALSLAPDLGFAVSSLAWSLVGFLAGLGIGWLLWGRR